MTISWLGPISNNLTDIIICFRIHRIGLSTDMFREIKLPKQRAIADKLAGGVAGIPS